LSQGKNTNIEAVTMLKSVFHDRLYNVYVLLLNLPNIVTIS